MSHEHTHGKQFRDKYGPWALVTGAAQGIGKAYVEALAQRGLRVILVDKQEEALRQVAEEQRQRYGIDTRAVIVDLAAPEFIATVCQHTEDVAVGLLICNAALGTIGPFLDEPLEDLRLAIAINCTAPALLARVFGKRMADRGRGGIILMASGTAYYGNPFVASYAATKAYNLILGEGLWYELRDCGVDVLAFVPGPSNTPGLRKGRPALKEGVEAGTIKLPSRAAEAALRALGRAPSATRDLRIALQIAFTTRILPRRKAIESFGGRLAMLQRTRRTQ
ncbi:MAG: SDR family NAD(P)-dependent oxidoreductase [Candidatus Binatia bacterium]